MDQAHEAAITVDHCATSVLEAAGHHEADFHSRFEKGSVIAPATPLFEVNNQQTVLRGNSRAAQRRRRSDILAGTRKAIATKGFGGLVMKDVADLCGLCADYIQFGRKPI